MNLQQIVLLLFINVFFSLFSYAQVELTFSKQRGYYNQAFQLQITCSDPTATIKYTTNKNTPSVTSGLIYSNAINISQTTIIRAVAINAAGQSKVYTHSYLFFDDIISDNQMQTYITQDPIYGSQMETALKALPAICLTSSGISHSSEIDIEAASAVEMFFPDGSRTGFMENSGLQTWGASPTNPKKNYRLEFKSTYGAKRLDYDVFKVDNYDNTEYGVPPTDDFDVLLLRAGSQDALNSEFGDENLAQFVRNRVMFDIQMEMGYPASHGRFVHLYLNGKYNGQYHLMERPDPQFFESYYGRNADDYEVYKSGEYWNGEDSIWATVGYYANFRTELSIANTYNYLDLDQAADYLVLMSYASGFDWSAVNNCLAGGSILPGNGGYKFILWDVDYSLGNGGNFHPANGGDINYFNAPVIEDGPIPDNLMSQLQFKYMLADKVECACYNNGLLTPSVIDSMYMHRINQVSTSLIAESARWGNTNFSYVGGNNLLHIPKANWDVNDEFMTELNRVRNDFIPNRTNSMINHLKIKGVTSDLKGAQYNQYGGLANTNHLVRLTNPNIDSEIYYTLDGTDPRAIGGGINSTAILYSSPFVLPTGVVEMKARVRDNNHTITNIRKWSGMCPQTFYANQNYQQLVINEIHYNPKDSIYTNPQTMQTDTLLGRNFEFIEIKNTGNQTIYLKNVALTKGASFIFDENTTIAAGDFLVIAEDAQWFEERYGFAPDGEFNGKLDNGGEKIWLENPVGNIIDSLRFDDEIPWDTIPDLGVYSLALLNTDSDNSMPQNWSKQIFYTTPGAENQFCAPLANNTITADASCSGINDGFISTSISAGIAPYTYLWNTGQSTPSISNLSPGYYTLTAKDARQCTLVETFEISQLNAIQLNIATTNTTSNTSANGSVSISTSGGNAPYNYNWSNGANSANLNSLAIGNYQLNVEDTYGCTTSASVKIINSNCTSFFNETGNNQIPTVNIKVNNYIATNGVVPLNHFVSYQAGNYVELKNNFEVKKGAQFEAVIEVCN